MSQAEQFATFVADIKKEKRIMPDLKLITGGSEGGSDNWLSDLAVGTQFFVEDKLERGNFLLLKLEVIRTEPKVVNLWAYPSTFGTSEEMEGKAFGDVQPTRFINRFGLVKIISVPSKEEQE